MQADGRCDGCGQPMCRLYGCAQEKLAGDSAPPEQVLRDMAAELGLSPGFVAGALERQQREESVTRLANDLNVPPEVLTAEAANHWTALLPEKTGVPVGGLNHWDTWQQEQADALVDPFGEMRRTAEEFFAEEWRRLPGPSITRGGVQWPVDLIAAEAADVVPAGWEGTWQAEAWKHRDELFARKGPDPMSDDKLLQALDLLADSCRPNPAFDMILWCPDEHVLSFRRASGNGWVNIWLHAQGEDEHVAETNGGNGWGGRKPQVLWVDGEDRDGQWVTNTPRRRTDGTQHPVAELARPDRFEHLERLPPVPGLESTQ